MSAKQDRQGVRTATDVERKYNLGQSVTQSYVQSSIRSSVTAATNECKDYVDSKLKDVGDYSEKITALEKSNKEIKTLANDAKAMAETAHASAENATTAAGNAQSTADSAMESATTALNAMESMQAEVDALRQDIAGIDIGGRNMLVDSDKKNANADYMTASYFLGNDIPIEGKTYTLRLNGQLGEGKEYFWVCNTESNIYLATLTDNGDGTYSATFQWTNTDGTNVVDPANVSVFAYPEDVVVSSSIKWIKLEAGNKATSWTPAPEDEKEPELLVTIEVDSLDTETLASDRTYAEIEEAILAGKNVRVKLISSSVTGHIFLQMVSHTEGSEIAFCGYFDNLPLLLKITA